MAWLEQRIASAPVPVITVGSTCLNVTGYGKELLARHNLNLLGGIEDSVQAVGHALRWLDNRVLGRCSGGRQTGAAR